MSVAHCAQDTGFRLVLASVLMGGVPSGTTIKLKILVLILRDGGVREKRTRGPRDAMMILVPDAIDDTASESVSDATSACGAPSVVKIIAGKLFDPYSLTLLENQTIRVSRTTGRVLDVSPRLATGLGRADSDGEEVIDLSGLTVLPGFVDAHVHCEPFFVIPSDIMINASDGQFFSTRIRRRLGRTN